MAEDSAMSKLSFDFMGLPRKNFEHHQPNWLSQADHESLACFIAAMT